VQAISIVITIGVNDASRYYSLSDSLVPG
jgi:hypothetical protein